MRMIIGLLAIGALIAASAWFVYYRDNAAPDMPAPAPSTPTTTEEKADYVNASEDMIKVELPYLGAVVGKEFTAIGEARGQWFFEGSFPIEVIGKDDEILARTFATAAGDWMTTEFVPFKSETITLPESYFGEATLILRKDNPSGLPENDASISVPIIVEY